MPDIHELDSLTPEQRRKVQDIAQEVLEVAHEAAHGQRRGMPARGRKKAMNTETTSPPSGLASPSCCLSLPVPYYDRDGITIYHGDCKEIVPLLGRFDLLLTDPPYGIGRDGSKRTTSRHGGRKAYDFLGWDAERPPAWLIGMLLDAAEKHIVWGGNYFVDSLPPTMKWLVWDKGQRIAQSDGELAWTSLEGAMRIHTLNRVALMQDGAEHPTQKPEQLIRWCIQQAGEVQTILDPFAGSGTTGRAAKDLGKRAVLIEREERFCEIAARRLSQDVLPLHTTND